jgi:carboxypeptidase Q
MTMKITSLFVVVFLCSRAGFGQTDSSIIASVYREALSHGECYENLRVLCKQVGHRLAGSEGADKAIEATRRMMERYELDTVFLMPVQVPQWRRGKVERLVMHLPAGSQPIPCTALGGSVGSGGVVKAEVIQVKSLDELKKLTRKEVEGKIVFINKALDPVLINTGAAYGGAYDVRGRGPSISASKGAVACIIRSLTTAEDRYPHTGATNYEDSIPKIPAMAISSVDAAMLSDAMHTQAVKLEVELDCILLEPRIQYNVIGELRGTENSNEFIVVGGHLDSWDIGEGAHDDGAGCMQSLEVLRTLKAIGYKPRHSLRCVLFINEEFGNDGGEEYARVAQSKGWTHKAAIESDGGGFSPKGFSIEAENAYFDLLLSWKPLFETYELFFFRQGWSGVDIGPLRAPTTPLFGLKVDPQRYFDYHHSANDVFENVNKRELTLGAAAMAALTVLLDRHLP